MGSSDAAAADRTTSRGSGADWWRTSTGCSARGTTPRTRCRRRSCAHCAAGTAFGHRSSVRVWLYRIATNVCLTALEQRHRRALPSGLGRARVDDTEPPVVAEPSTWVQPDPAGCRARPGRIGSGVAGRRAAGLHRGAAASAADSSGRCCCCGRCWTSRRPRWRRCWTLSVAAVKSALQRARARLDEMAPSRDEPLAEPTEPRAQELLDAYMAAWESADAAAFERLLRADATLEGVPSRTWFAGKETCVALPRFRSWARRARGRWSPTAANRQPAVVVYRGGADRTGWRCSRRPRTGWRHRPVRRPDTGGPLRLPTNPAPNACLSPGRSNDGPGKRSASWPTGNPPQSTVMPAPTPAPCAGSRVPPLRVAATRCRAPRRPAAGWRGRRPW